MYKRGTFENDAAHSGVVSAKEVKAARANCENELVMKERKPLRSKWLTIRLSAEEENRVIKLSKQTTCRSLSEYGRAVLLKEPVVILHRNGSADDFLEEMILLKKELNAIGTNFNQAVHRLHTLANVPEVKAWLLVNENTKAAFLKTTEEILRKAEQIHALWSQK